MIISNFSGGLNTKLHPAIIADNQAIEFENIDIMSGVLKSLKEPKTQDIIATNPLPFYFKNNWSFSQANTSYARLLSTAFRAYDDKLEKSLDGKTWVNLWIKPPQTAPEVEAGDLYPDGDSNAEGFYGDDIYYCYTYYNINDGSESAPSPLSAKITIGKQTSGGDSHWIKGQAVLTILKSDDSQVTHINIYRLGGGITSFQLAKQINNMSAKIIENTTNDLLGDNLKTIGYIAPPLVSYICAYYALLFGVSYNNSNILYFSDEANPMTWNPLNYIVFDESIVGLGSSQLGLLVFTEYRVYIVYGTTSSEFQRYLLFDNIGCVSHNSIQSYKGSVIWQAKDSFYIFDGNNCRNLTLTTLEALDNIVISSCMSNEIYYGVFDNGDIITIDFRFAHTPITILTNQNAEGIFPALNKVFITSGDKLLDLFGSENDRVLKWKSKQYTDNSITTAKNYKYIYIYCEGDFMLKIYTDNTSPATEIKLVSGFNQVHVGATKRIGYFIQFEIEGRGQIISIDYSDENRLVSKGV